MSSKSRATANARQPDRWIFYGLLALLAWVPIPLGSKFPLGFGFLEIAAFGLCFAWLVQQLVRKNPAPSFTGPDRTVLLLFLGVLAYQLAQVIPLPLALLRLFSPTAFDVYAFAQPEGARAFSSISVDIGASLQELLKSAAYVALFLLTLLTVNSQKRLRQMLYVLVAVGCAQALFGVLDAYAGGVLFRKQFTGLGGTSYAATGTYVKYNHFGGLLEMTIPLTVGLIMAQAAGKKAKADWRNRLIASSEFLLSRRPLLYLCLLAMITALFYSTSRGSTISLLGASGIGAWLAFYSRERSGSAKSTERAGSGKRLAVALAPVLIVGFLLGFDQLFSRLQQLGLDTDRHVQREVVYGMIADYPLVGAGSGNWIQAYPAYQQPDPYREKLVSHVHNDYLELLAEQGVIGFALFGSAVLTALSSMIGGLRRRRDTLMRGALFGCVTATVSLLIHSLADFNLHIPANAAWFSVILALGLIAVRMPHDASPTQDSVRAT